MTSQVESPILSYNRSHKAYIELKEGFIIDWCCSNSLRKQFKVKTTDKISFVAYLKPSEIPADPEYLIFCGTSRRSYKDAPNSIKGEMIAFRRAILFSRPVELS